MSIFYSLKMNRNNAKSSRGANNRGRQISRQNDNTNSNLTLRSLNTTIKCTKTFRFEARASVSKLDVKDTDLFFLLGVATSSTTLAPIFGSVRFKRIDLWKVNPNPTNIDLLAIEYKGNNPNYGNNSVIHSANAISPMQFAHVKSKPPVESYAAAWLYPSSYNLFQITCGQGTLVDVTIEFTLLDDTPSFSDPTVNFGLTVGSMYCHTLTGQNASNIFIPQGWNFAN